MKISQKVYNEKDLINLINNLFQKKIRPIKMQKKLMIIGKKILNRTYKELEIILNKR